MRKAPLDEWAHSTLLKFDMSKICKDSAMITEHRFGRFQEVRSTKYQGGRLSGDLLPLWSRQKHPCRLLDMGGAIIMFSNV